MPESIKWSRNTTATFVFVNSWLGKMAINSHGDLGVHKQLGQTYTLEQSMH